MIIHKRMRLTPEEINEIAEATEGYAWATIDLVRNSLVVGDIYVSDMRDMLLVSRSKPENIYGVGIDLATGAIDHLKAINRRNPSLSFGELDDSRIEKIETMMRYFFDNLPCFQNQTKQPRFTKKIIASKA